MSLTINEAIARFEANAEQNERWANAGLNPEANAEYAAEHRQLAAWLRELVERRKEPGIITCGECKHYKIDHPKANGYHCCYRCHNIFPMKENDFCSRAVRRTECEQ